MQNDYEELRQALMRLTKLLVKKDITRNFNLMDVRVIRAQMIFDMNQELAEYVRFHSTQELHEFLITSDAVKGILKNWFKFKSAGFRISCKDVKFT